MFEQMNYRSQWRILLVTSLVTCTSFIGLETVLADSVTNQTANAATNQGIPTRRVGGGSRSCPRVQPCPLPLLALIPDGPLLTVSHLPTLLFYVPKIQSTQTVQIEFVLRDENDNLVYEKLLTANGQAGVVALTLTPSKTFTGLALDRSYHWYLSIIYDSRDRAQDSVVEGGLRRIPLEAAIARQLERSSPIEQVKLYETEKLLPDALSKLADLKRSQPQDQQLALLWTNLIASLQLPFASDQAPKENPAFLSLSAPNP